MGFFKSLRENYREAKNKHNFDINSQRISKNLKLLYGSTYNYGLFVSNTSFMFSEQIKITALKNIDEQELNSLSVLIGFWLIVLLYVSKYKNNEDKRLYTFQNFYSEVSQKFLNDFIENNPTVGPTGEKKLRDQMNSKMDSYIENPTHLIEFSNGIVFKSRGDLSTDFRNDLYNFAEENFDIRIFPPYLDEIIGMWNQLSYSINNAINGN